MGELSNGVRPTAGRRRRGFSLSGRLALQLFLLAVLLTAVCAWLSLTLVERTLEEQLSAELDRLCGRVAFSLEQKRLALADSLERLEGQLIGRDSSSLERLLQGGPGAAGVAGNLLSSARLDSLEVLDSEDVVLSSAPRPERAGLPLAGRADRVASSETALPVRLVGLDGEPWGLLAEKRLSVGSRELVLVGGALLDEPFLELVAGGGAALLLDRNGEAPVSSTAGQRLDPRQIAEAWPRDGGDGGAWSADGRDGSRWRVRTVSLDRERGGGPVAVVVAVERSRLDPVLDRMRRSFLALGCAAGLVAALAGAWIARRVTRPVRDLVRAFDAVSSGEADYGFPTARQDELQELVASVSRLRRALEAQQRRSVAAERVATWRDVARHVAHEVKNPLAPIRLTVENLLRARRRAPDRFDALFDEGMRTILDEVEQLSRMVGEFSEFARLPLPSRRPEQLERLVDSVLDLYAAEPGITVTRRFAAGLPPVPVDADQISRALKNVIGNAVEASRGKPLQLEIGTFLEEGMVGVEVADNGPGFSEEAARRVFEPYFTTRAEGTGLGMALTYRIVVEHGGVITAGNRPRGGATVSIRLPLQAGEPGGEEDPGRR